MQLHDIMLHACIVFLKNCLDKHVQDKRMSYIARVIRNYIASSMSAVVPSLHTFLKSATSLPIRAFGKVKIFTAFFTKCSNSHRVRKRQNEQIF